MSGDGLDYIRQRYSPLAEAGRRVTIYTGEQGVIVGTHPKSAHYLHVLVDGDAEPILLHPSWEITYHEVRCPAAVPREGA